MPPPSSSSLVTVGNLAAVLRGRDRDRDSSRDWDMGRDRDSGAMMTTFVVIIAPGSRGDVAPLLALAQALKTQHVDVAFACHAKYAQAAEDNGYNAHSQNFYALKGHKDPEAIRGGPATVGDDAEQMWSLQLKDYKACLLTGEPWGGRKPDVCLLNWFSMPALHVAEAADVHVAFTWFTPFTRTNDFTCFLCHSHDNSTRGATLKDIPQGLRRFVGDGPMAVARSYVVFETLLWKAFGTTMDTWRRELRLPAEPQGMTQEEWESGGHFALALRSKIPILYAFPSSIVPRPRDWPPWAQPCGYFVPPTSSVADEPMPPSLVKFLAHDDGDLGRPVVYAGLGSAATSDPSASFRVMLTCVRAIGARLVVVTGGGKGLVVDDDAGNDDDVLVLPYAPHSKLLPRVRAAIHHGGAGTTGACFSAGVPQVICAVEFDHFFWARIVQARGVGDGAVSLRGDNTRERLGASLSFALGPEASAAAQRIKADLSKAPNGSDVAAAVIRAVANAV